jgi:hypothetical protein
MMLTSSVTAAVLSTSQVTMVGDPSASVKPNAHPAAFTSLARRRVMMKNSQDGRSLQQATTGAGGIVCGGVKTTSS